MTSFLDLRCPDCGVIPFAPYEPHDCFEGLGECVRGRHRWIDVTPVGSSERSLICGRFACTATKSEPFDAWYVGVWTQVGDPVEA